MIYLRNKGSLCGVIETAPNTIKIYITLLVTFLLNIFSSSLCSIYGAI